jgi:hypothetical protein
MTPFIIYLLKSSASLALLFILYRLAMSNEKRHRLNRFLLISILFVSALIPLIQIPVLQEKPVVKQVEFVRDLFVTEMQPGDFNVQSTEIIAAQEESRIHFNPLLFCYFLVIGFLLLRLQISFTRIFQLMKKAEKFEFQQFVLLVIKDFIQPFSFVKHIFISEKDYSINKEILIAHEAEHICRKHYLDLFLAELFTLIFWFNPFMWLLKRELKLVHEYQADQAVLKKGIDAQKYQLLVLEKAVGERRFALANYFTQKPILKRIKMMKKNNLNRWGGLKLILFVPLLVLLLQAFAKPDNLIDNVFEVVPAIQQDEKSKWLDKWTVENIKHGVYQPDGLTSDEYPIGKKNIIRILLTRDNELLIENTSLKKEDIKLGVKNFIKGKNAYGITVPELQEKNLPFIGEVKVPKCIIHFNYDNASSIEIRNNFLQIFRDAYLEVRQEKAIELFNNNYFQLEDDKRNVVDKVVPILFGYSSIIISEPKPIEILLASGGKKVIIVNKEFLIEEIEDQLTKRNEILKELHKKWGYEIFSLKVDLNVEQGVSEEQIDQVKEIFRKAKFEHVNYKKIN